MNWVFATNSNFLIPISLQPDGVECLYCKDKRIWKSEFVTWTPFIFFITAWMIVRLTMQCIKYKTYVEFVSEGRRDGSQAVPDIFNKYLKLDKYPFLPFS